ncbi:MAG TPA: enoyl-CoA hydratase-related protein [Gemmatimonadales bacterium]|nr:enoyl-CoA hydratase-related protein [Gemmatimonadales bacterium]
MQLTHLTLDVRDGIATITINRPDKLNALNAAVIEDLGHVAHHLATDTAIRGAILTGSGTKAFAAGADIAEMAEQTPQEGLERARRGQAVFRLLETCGKPVIAAVNGFALGGGCELAMACHLRVASTSAKFGQPEVKLGICPGYGGTVRLPRLVGKGRAIDILVTGRMVEATEALQIGLVNRIVEPEKLMAESEALLRGIIAMGPLAVRSCLELVDAGMEVGLEEALRMEAAHFGLLSGSADQKEGMSAFLAKRPPSFQGR